MNKKVLTLCAGVLLVSGSAVFTVNALNAGGEKVQTAYVVKANAEGVAGYTKIAPTEDATKAALWHLVKMGEEERYYLAPNGTEAYSLNADGNLQIDPVEVFILNDGRISFDDENAWVFGEDKVTLYLWSEGSILDETSEKDALTLATKKTVDADLTNQSIVTFDGTNTSLKVVENSAEVVNATEWKWNNGTFTIQKDGGQVATLVINASNQDLEVFFEPDAQTPVVVVYVENEETGKLQLQIKKSEGATDTYTPLYVSSTDGLTTTTEGAKAAVLYDAEGKLVTTSELSSEVTYIIGEATTKNEVAVAYVTSEIEAVAGEGIPGTEYGTIPGIQYQENGTLSFVGGIEVTDAAIPVVISRKDGDKTEYLGIKNGKAVWGSTATTWVLEDGKLKSLDAEKAGNTVYYNGENQNVVTDAAKAENVVFGSTGAFASSTITVAAQSLMASPSSNECENPLLDTKNNDYVYIGGEVSGTMYYFKADGTLTDDITAAELWKVNQGNKTGNYWDYTFTSRTDTDKSLKIGSETHFQGNAYNYGIQLRTDGGNVELQTSGAIEYSSNAATPLGFYRSTPTAFTAEWLIHRYGSSFQLNITEDYNDKYVKEWHGNVFEDADLVPVVAVGPTNRLVEITDDRATISAYGDKTSFLLKDRNSGLYLALRLNEPWTNVVVDLAGKNGYKFELLSEENIREVLRSGEVKDVPYMPYFEINYLKGTTECDQNTGETIVADDTEGFCIEVGQTEGNMEYDVIILEAGDTNNKDLYVTVNDNCANDSRKPTIKFASDNENIVRGEDGKNNPLLLKYVNIAFKAGEGMQYEEGNKMINLDGKVLGINESGTKAVPTEKEYFLFDKAEGQWIVTMTGAEGLTAANTNGQTVGDSRKFTFTNRENPTIKYSVKSMHYLGNNTYAVEYGLDKDDNQIDAFGQYLVKRWNGSEYDLNRANRDTLVITEANVDKTIAEDALGLHNMDSYANWTKEDLQDRTFQLSVDAAAQLYVTENEGKDSHFLGLTADETEVTNWRLVPFTAARVHDKDAVKYLTQGTDSVYIMAHPQYYSGGKFYAYNDTTAIITYALQNIQNNEWLTYDPSQNQSILSMICDPNSKNFTTKDLDEAYRFVLKEKAEGAQKIESGAYNIIGVNAWEYGNNGKSKYVADADLAHYTLNFDNKLYGATSYQKLGAVEVEGAYEQPTSNDIFTIATTASQEYVWATPRDTVRIYGAEENDFLLYENGQFLNLGNTGDIAPAMVLDSAYVNRPGNNRYQYLLVVNPTYVEAEFDNHPNSPSVPHMIKPDTMYGRFLVNQIDSAVFVSRNHNNKFINDVEADEKEVKLGFQWGYHTGDALYLTEGEGKNSPVIEKIELGTPDFNKAKFAFKYVNEAAGDDFKVQTAWYDYDSAVKAGLDNKEDWTWNNEGYLKSVNGVIVVTNGYTHGEEFLMAQDETNPTANETIAAEGAISVVATDGAVVIKGAEGKNVVIATILGKVVANETINSDNETIAVPAGIAVVSVDGESFKVVVK